MDNLHNLLDLDLKHRKEHNFNDKNLVEVTKFKPSIKNVTDPMIISPEYKLHQEVNAFDEVASKFFNCNHWAKQVDQDVWKNVLIAGGSVLSLFVGLESYKDWKSDVDIFIYGLTPEEATNKIRTLSKYIFNVYEESGNGVRRIKDDKNDGDEPVMNNKRRKVLQYDYSKFSDDVTTSVYPDSMEGECNKSLWCLSKNCFTFKSEKIKVQFILRNYETMYQILVGFDLQNCSIGLDLYNKKLWTTPVGLYCLKTISFIIDPSRRSTSYEYRIAKYIGRGFNMILPDLDLSKVQNNKTINLKTLKIKVDNIDKNFIESSEIIPTILNDVSDYVAEDLVDNNNKYEYTVVNACSDIFYDSDKKIYFLGQTELIIPFVEPSLIFDGDDFLLRFMEGLFANGSGHFNYIPRQSLTKRKEGQNNRYFYSVRNSENTLDMIKIRYSVSSDKNFSLYINDLYKKKLEFVRMAFGSWRKTGIPLYWRTINPGTQFTGSFNPIMDNGEFYGSFKK